MAKVPEEKKKEQSPVEMLQESWNSIINEIILLERMWEKHQNTYKELQFCIKDMHPLDQRIMYMLMHKQIFRFFLEDVAREGRVGYDKLLTGGR